MNSLSDVYNEINEIKVALAVCRDRVDRHDSEIKELIGDVHEIKLNMGKVVGGIDHINADIKRLADEVGKLVEQEKSVNGAVDQVRGAWLFTAKLGAVIVGGASVIAVIGRLAGWWA